MGFTCYEECAVKSNLVGDLFDSITQQLNCGFGLSWSFIFFPWAASASQKRHKESQGGVISKKHKRSHKSMGLHPKKNRKAGMCL